MIFLSRHGVDQAPWALFDRSGDYETSARVHPLSVSPVDNHQSEIDQVCDLFGRHRH
jgi:hypothetical protein